MKAIKTLTKERITEIIEQAESSIYALLNLYKEVLKPINWDDTETIEPTAFHTNPTTTGWIIEELQRRYPENKEGIALLIMNKGFSGYHHDVPDWEVRIEDNAYQLK